MLNEVLHRYTKPLTDRVLVKEDNFELKCEVTSNPPVTIEWFADGQKLVRQNSELDRTSNISITQ